MQSIISSVLHTAFLTLLLQLMLLHLPPLPLCFEASLRRLAGLQSRRMRQLYSKSRSLKRLMSVAIGRRSREEESTEEIAAPVKSTWRCFSYEEIHAATDGFHKDNLVGRGGYAVVYRGVMADGQAIAVKTMVGASTDEQREKDFLTELGTVGHVRHPNVSALLGCCIDRGLHLVFEFSSRGSVSSNLHDASSPPMAWKLRHGIAVGTAHGLHYLHKECPRRIIHRDIKASNVLLTANFQPQISDFGLAKWLPSEWTHRAISPIEGTFGCLAPEYFMHGIVDEKTDVFAFGVFLLEIISGRKPVDGSHRSLLSWARPFLDDGSLQMLVDPRLGDDYDMEQLKRLSFAASLCIRATASLRPSMTEILELLEGGEISQDRWKMLEEEEVEEEFWGFDDLDDDDDDGDCDTPSTPSTGSS
ncbi:probable receptor-like serine/threonine-protein kinase At5g57670 [Musa acuminata AAA Group]|uniref:probable receptor-like serine/threonine-protein kinase At5g57670 n=1 Tax=Musa acuminata AAA Group TaxID=214697 RepID=UPI0031D4041C